MQIHYHNDTPGEVVDKVLPKRGLHGKRVLLSDDEETDGAERKNKELLLLFIEGA